MVTVVTPGDLFAWRRDVEKQKGPGDRSYEAWSYDPGHEEEGMAEEIGESENEEEIDLGRA